MRVHRELDARKSGSNSVGRAAAIWWTRPLGAFNFRRNIRIGVTSFACLGRRVRALCCRRVFVSICAEGGACYLFFVFFLRIFIFRGGAVPGRKARTLRKRVIKIAYSVCTHEIRGAHLCACDSIACVRAGRLLNAPRFALFYLSIIGLYFAGRRYYLTPVRPFIFISFSRSRSSRAFERLLDV